MSGKDYALLRTSALTSRTICSIPLALEAVYYRLHLASDKYGVLIGDEWDVMAHVFANRFVDPVEAMASIDALVGVRLVERWSEDGKTWLYLARFEETQTADYKRKRGKQKTPIPPSLRPKGRGGMPQGQNLPNSRGDALRAEWVCPQGEVRGDSSLGLGPNEHHSRFVPDGSSLASNIGHQLVADREEDELARLHDSQGGQPAATHLVSRAQNPEAAA